MTGRALASIATLLIPVTLVRVFDQAEYGTYKQLFLVGVTLTSILAFGVPQSLYYFLPRTEQGRPYVVHVLVLLAGAGAVAAALVLAATPWIGLLFSAPRLPEYRYALAAYAGFFLAATPLETLFTSQGRTGLAAVNYLVWDTLRAAAMTVPILLGLGLHTTMWSVAALMVARTLATWGMAVNAAPGPWWNRAALRAQLAYAVPFGAAMAISVPQHSLHQWVVSAHFDPALFAIYTVGCFQLPIVDLLYTPTTEVLMVHVGELERGGRLADAVALFRDAAARLAFVFVPTCAFLIAAAPAFIEAIFGTRFLPAVPLFRVSTLAVLFGCFPVDGLLRARGETRAILASYLAKAVITVPLVLLLVETMGLIGGVVSWLIAEGVGKLLLVGRLPRALQLRSRRQLLGLIPFRDGLRAGVAAGVSVGLMLIWHRVIAGRFDFLPHTFFWRLFPVASDAVVFTLTYVAVLHAQGIRVLRVLSMFRRQRPAVAPVLSAQPDPGDAAEAPVA